jgi:hypothetical protein
MQHDVMTDMFRCSGCLIEVPVEVRHTRWCPVCDKPLPWALPEKTKAACCGVNWVYRPGQMPWQGKIYDVPTFEQLLKKFGKDA